MSQSIFYKSACRNVCVCWLTRDNVLSKLPPYARSKQLSLPHELTNSFNRPLNSVQTFISHIIYKSLGSFHWDTKRPTGPFTVHNNTLMSKIRFSWKINFQKEEIFGLSFFSACTRIFLLSDLQIFSVTSVTVYTLPVNDELNFAWACFCKL